MDIIRSEGSPSVGSSLHNGASIQPMSQRTQFDSAHFLPGAICNSVLLSWTSLTAVSGMVFATPDSPQFNEVLGYEVAKLLYGLFKAGVITGVVYDSADDKSTVRLNLASGKNTAALTLLNALRYGAEQSLLEWADLTKNAEVPMGTTAYDKSASGGKLVATIEEAILEAANRVLMLLH